MGVVSEDPPVAWMYIDLLKVFFFFILFYFFFWRRLVILTTDICQ